MISTQPVETKIWTYDDYAALTDGERYQVINGSLLREPAPRLYHQDISSNLGFILQQYVRQQGLGKVYFAPVDVILDPYNVLQPDIVFVAEENFDRLQRRGIVGPPDMVVEIISPSSTRTDRYDKRKLYGQFGVKEYWIVDPANRSIEVLILDDGNYELCSFASETGTAQSTVLTGFAADVQEVFGTGSIP